MIGPTVASKSNTIKSLLFPYFKSFPTNRLLKKEPIGLKPLMRVEKVLVSLSDHSNLTLRRGSI